MLERPFKERPAVGPATWGLRLGCANALGQDPARWTLLKGHVRVRQGRFQQAIEEYARAIAINPDSSEAYRYRAHAYRRIKEYDRAVADYTKAMELTAGSLLYALPYQRATPLWILGRTDEALDDYRRVRTLLDRRMPRGFHIVGWDARTNQGDVVAPGVYFSRMIVNGKKEGGKKLTVLR